MVLSVWLTERRQTGLYVRVRADEKCVRIHVLCNWKVKLSHAGYLLPVAFPPSISNDVYGSIAQLECIQNGYQCYER